MNSEPVVDFSSLESFTGGDKNLMKIHINSFLQFAPSQMDELKQKLNGQDWMELGGVAHKLKPKCAYMGIKEAETLLRTIEMNAKELNETDKLPELVTSAEAIINQAILELKTFVAAN